MTSTEERVSRLEGAYEHMASRTELVKFEGEMAVVVTELRQAITALTAEVFALKAEMAAVKQLLEARLPRPMGFQPER